MNAGRVLSEGHPGCLLELGRGVMSSLGAKAAAGTSHASVAFLGS